jgi:plasmid stabilization system protein ParE
VSYRVVVVPRAKAQLLEQALWWSENRSPAQAFDWLTRFEDKLRSLAKNPARFPPAREGTAIGRDLRELYFGLGSKKTHRAIFEIRENDIVVHSIRHLAQADLTADDI